MIAPDNILLCLRYHSRLGVRPQPMRSSPSERRSRQQPTPSRPRTVPPRHRCCTRALLRRNGSCALTTEWSSGCAQRILGASDTVDTKVALIDALRRTEGTAWQPWMASLAEHASEPALRAAATEQLRYVPTSWSVPALRAVMMDPDPRVREAAVRAAGRLPPAEVPIDDLMRCLADEDDAVAGFAARSLGWHQVTAARDGIEALLSRDNERTRQNAQNALRRLQ